VDIMVARCDGMSSVARDKKQTMVNSKTRKTKKSPAKASEKCRPTSGKIR
jgi:hypothetical protein